MGNQFERRPVKLTSRQPGLRYALLALLTLAAGLAGYVGYVLYPRFHLPPAAGASLLFLAAAAGTASFFSPCSFPLLLSILARAPGVSQTDRRTRGPALAFAASLALGAATFLLISGLVIAAVGTAIFAGVTFTSTPGRLIRAAVGAVLIFLGLVQLNMLPFEFRWFEPAAHGFLRRQASFRRQHPMPGYFVFGLGYVLAGFGWTGPIMAGLASVSLTTGGFGAALIAFVVAALTMLALIFILAVVITQVEARTVAGLRENAPTIKRWGGSILVLVGLWFLLLALFASYFARIFPV